MSISENNVSDIRKSHRIVESKSDFSPAIITYCKKPRKTQKISVKRNVKLKTVICAICNKKQIPYRKTRKHGPASTTNVPLSNSSGNVCLFCVTVSSNKRKKCTKEMASTQMKGKEKYLDEARAFAKSLTEVLQDSEAERLFCPSYKSQPCACLQKYVLSDANESQSRAYQLLHLLKEAKLLSNQKFYSHETSSPSDVCENGRKKSIGLGNGQKRSIEFEQFVILQRQYLREEIKLCERACQKVLFYSNNFLHKKLKTEPEKRRADRKKGKAALGLLIPISEFAHEPCCPNKCVLMALTHSTLVQQWRERAAASQADAWRVLAEMLTPSAGGKANCFKFVAKVTGCSNSTISKVEDQMALTGGEREPPEHGLKKWWQEQASKYSGDLVHGEKVFNERTKLNVKQRSTISSAKLTAQVVKLPCNVTSTPGVLSSTE